VGAQQCWASAEPSRFPEPACLERVNPGQCAVYLLAVATPRACTEVSLMEAEWCTCTPPAVSPHAFLWSVPAQSPVREDAGAWDVPSAVGHDAAPLNACFLLAAVRLRRGHARTAPSSAPPQSSCACPRMSQIQLRWPGVKVLLTTAIAPRLLAASFCMALSS
jgi:hypothetical protein